jgi:hypothetical protein
LNVLTDKKTGRNVPCYNVVDGEQRQGYVLREPAKRYDQGGSETNWEWVPEGDVELVTWAGEKVNDLSSVRLRLREILRLLE